MKYTGKIRQYAAMTAAVVLSAGMLIGCSRSDSAQRGTGESGSAVNTSGNVVAGAGAEQTQPRETQGSEQAQTQQQEAQNVSGTTQSTQQTPQNEPQGTQQTTQQTPQNVSGSQTSQGGSQQTAPASAQKNGEDEDEDGEETFTGLFEKPDGTEAVRITLENDTTLTFRFRKSRISGTAKVYGDTAVYQGDDLYSVTFTVADDELGIVVGGEDADKSPMNGVYYRVVEGDDEETEEDDEDDFLDDDDDEDTDYDELFAGLFESETDD